jgi:hypothetical protein
MDAEPLNYARRAALRETFKAQVAAGEMRPLVLPYCLFGSFILPILYFSISHTRQPWLFKARYAIWVVCVALNIRMMSHTSSTNMACAYAAGLLGTWAIVWNAALLVFMDPQGGSRRAEKRRKAMRREQRSAAKDSLAKSVAGYGLALGEGTEAGGLYEHANGVNGHRSIKADIGASPTKRADSSAPDESVAAVMDEYEYFWQPFPEDGSFLTRLDWAFDLCTAFRGAGRFHDPPLLIRAAQKTDGQ